MNTDGKPETLGEVCQQTGAIAMATQDTDGSLQWTVLLCNGSTARTSALAHTASWRQLHRGTTE
jgi:hypothetical protein